MWPVMTLTLLLQLTDEEQLFAANTAPVIQPQELAEEVMPVVVAEEETCAQWPEAMREDC